MSFRLLPPLLEAAEPPLHAQAFAAHGSSCSLHLSQYSSRLRNEKQLKGEGEEPGAEAACSGSPNEQTYTQVHLPTMVPVQDVFPGLLPPARAGSMT